MQTHIEKQSFTSELAELEAREAIIAESLQGLDTSQQQQLIGEELLWIRDKKLYRAAGFKSFRAYLDNRHNRMSRPRAYQLINFAKRRQACSLTGEPVPATKGNRAHYIRNLAN
jgi:hypothetical protein